jgi:hypothetical protein
LRIYYSLLSSDGERYKLEDSELHMAEFRLTKKEETDLKEQFERWKTIMNWRIAPLAFAAVIAAIPVEKYRIVICSLGLSVITGAYIVARSEFPKVFSGLQSKKIGHLEKK